MPPVRLCCGMTILGKDAATDPSLVARRLIRGRGHAALATSLGGAPYASLVATACDIAGNPLLLLSDLAQHSANLRADPRLSLLFEDTEGHADPLAGPRLSVIGEASAVDDDAARARFVARHPTAARYAGFADFRLYRVAAARGHLVAGFGRITWVDGAHLRVDGELTALAEAEAEIVAHMNTDHAEAVRLLSPPGRGWRMTGIDPEGIDLRRGAKTARREFAAPVRDPREARAALIALVEVARAACPTPRRGIILPPHANPKG